MAQQTEALVLRSLPFGESDLILHLLVPGSGRLTAIAKGARRSVKRFSGTLDLFQHLRVTMDPRRRNSMARLDQATLLRNFDALRVDPARFALGCFLLELFDHPRTLVEQWPAILGAAWLDARQAPPAATPGYRARAFVSALERASVQSAGAAGAGQQLRIADDTLIEGRGLLLGDVLLHATALNRRHDYVLAA